MTSDIVQQVRSITESITVRTVLREKKLVATLVGAERKGLAFGWFNFAIGIAALPSSLIFGWLYEQYGPLVAFGWGAGLSAIAALLLMSVSTKPLALADELSGKMGI